MSRTRRATSSARELDADFDTANFTHEAVFNRELSRIEMYLESQCEQDVRLGTLRSTIRLERGERILTELSHKFRFEQLRELLCDCGLEPVRHYQPENRYFSLILATRPG
ncbi:MAG: L-histidine N(alpha)-methyltransferase [Gammaproteobacteria bacterium]